MKVKVSVTQEDIDKGYPRTCDGSPIAIALKRCFPNAKETYLRWTYGGIDDTTFPMTDEMRVFTDNYDHERPVEPFDFEFELPDSLAHLVREGQG